MRYVSIFSGIEAASVAWEPLGWEPLAFAEIDEFPSAVLAKRFPEVPNLGDITKVDWTKFKEEHGAIDVVVGGSPCQSFSIAGRREGLQGASGLMYEYVRCVRELMPSWLVWENVIGALSSERGWAFEQLLSSLDELGYGLAWSVLDSEFFGVAQRRQRLFLVGHLGDTRACEVLLEQEGLRWDTPSLRAKREELARASGRGPEGGCGAWSLKSRTGADTYIKPDGSVGTAGKGALVSEECAFTLATRVDQTIAQTVVIDRASFNQGANARFPPPHREAGRDGHAGGEEPACGRVFASNGEDVVGTLCARDWRGVGNQFVREGKVICQMVGAKT